MPSGLQLSCSLWRAARISYMPDNAPGPPTGLNSRKKAWSFDQASYYYYRLQNRP